MASRKGVQPKHYPALVYPGGASYLAEAPDVPACLGRGATPDKALADLSAAIARWAQAESEAGRTPPSATKIKPVAGHSGKFVVRLPRSLHARLARQAQREGVSLNQWIVSLLAEASVRAR